ncbi:hypothetical protein C347_06633 [Cryptococcus neoformans AD2-60a]|nr:hypothetical protein C347_06633 [Cryptococcus neoformans var. grubii AD2-60a]OXC81240.1 hypothetical protein C344_06541 [Cryptococcus neoformans var. grubii AD1-7a]OXH22782.1 hypothetical protein J005_06672 [Cryptococcus neoformans var. grubii]
MEWVCLQLQLYPYSSLYHILISHSPALYPMSAPYAPAPLLGNGWTHLASFDDLDDDEYEHEEEVYVTLDLGTTFDNKSLQAESQYQLIGLDTPTPFLKLGNQVFKGEITPLIGDEIICGLIRNHEDPHNPTHPPLFSTSQRITFQPGTLRPKDQSTPVPVPAPGHGLNISEPAQGQGTESGLSGTGSGAGGPSTSFTGAVPRPRAGGKRGNKTRRVIEHPDELNTFDLDAMGPHQSGMSMFHLPCPSPSSSHPLLLFHSTSSSIQPPYHVKEANTTNPSASHLLVELGPRVMESLGLGLSSDGQGVLLTKKEMENVLLGVPVTGKKGRPKKPHYLGED